jgi:HPt (histidine-containing phosphotransfer) domain-containing protein
MMLDNDSQRLGWSDTLALINVDGDVNDLKDLLAVWLRQTPRLLGELVVAIQCKNSESLHLAAHTLKGSLQILGMAAASELAAALETAGRIDELEGASLTLMQLQRLIEEATGQIKIYMGDR